MDASNVRGASSTRGTGTGSGGSDLQAELDKERNRLVKLWDAYERQEQELLAAKERLELLEGTVTEQGHVIHRLRAVLVAHGLTEG
jgi:hypothetical protein